VKASTVGHRELGAPTINVKTSTTGPREVPELKFREHPPSTSKCRRRVPGRCQRWRSGSDHHQRENVDDRPPGGTGARDPGAPTINVKTSTAGPREVPKLEIQERPPSM
jgi:hypothetical protein